VCCGHRGGHHPRRRTQPRRLRRGRAGGRRPCWPCPAAERGAFQGSQAFGGEPCRQAISTSMSKTALLDRSTSKMWSALSHVRVPWWSGIARASHLRRAQQCCGVNNSASGRVLCSPGVPAAARPAGVVRRAPGRPVGVHPRLAWGSGCACRLLVTLPLMFICRRGVMLQRLCTYTDVP